MGLKIILSLFDPLKNEAQIKNGQKVYFKA